MAGNAQAVDRIVATYCEAWSVADGERRALLLRGSVTDEVAYTDPGIELRGMAALHAHIASVIAQHPGARIEITSALDRHHRFLRFAWRKILADGSSLPEGLDVCELAADGRLQNIIGFFGPLRCQRPRARGAR